MFYRVKNLFEMGVGQHMKSRPKKFSWSQYDLLGFRDGAVYISPFTFFSTVWENSELDIVFLTSAWIMMLGKS